MGCASGEAVRALCPEDLADAARARGRQLVVIAEHVEGELRGQLQVAVVKAHGFGDNRKSILADPPILIGGTVFMDE